MEMTKSEDALSLFGTGFNCAQALMATYGIAYGIDYETALRVSSAFGGGMGETGDTCGAVTGAVMVIGLKYGSAHADEKEEKDRTNEVAERFVRRFRARNNTVVCRELLGVDLDSGGHVRQGPGNDTFAGCPGFVRDAAEILEEIL